MPIPQRIPTLTDGLQSMLALGVEVGSILDVGVLDWTPPLAEVFPHLKHHLFEPIEEHADQIKRYYAALDFELHQVALSDTEGSAWQLARSIDGSGTITHSRISDQPETKETYPGLVDCRPVRKTRLDTVIGGLDAAPPYLLKIDVDGHELPILAGATETLRQTAAVVIEVTARTFLARVERLANEGFLLFDIVDLIYYRGVFYQADVIFLPADRLARSLELRPMDATDTFSPDAWHPRSQTLP